jgi:DHA1 family bicyclomycin/chloramphenicol resistance-like MFS transporter
MMAPGIGMLLVARTVQGFAASSGPVIARAIVRDRFQGAEAARFMSQLAGAMAVVPLLAPVLGSWLLYCFDWRSQFGMLLLFGLLTLAGLRSLRETCPSIGVAPLAFGPVLRQFGTCLTQRRFLGFVLCGGAAFAASFTWISSASWIVIDLLGVPATQFGYTFMLVVTGYMGGSFASARLVPRIGVQRTLRWGVTAALGGASLLLVQALWLGPSLGGVLLGVFCSFLGGGLCLPNSQMGAISEFPMNAGGASAVFGFVQTAMASGFGWLVGHAYDGTLLPTAFIMCTGAICAAAGYLLLFGLRRGGLHA